MSNPVSHAPGAFIAAFVLIAQIEIAWFLFRQWRHNLSAGQMRAILSILVPVWAVTLTGIVIDLTGLQYKPHSLPPALIDFTIAVTSLWGFTSLMAINIYAAVAFLGRRTSKVSPGRRRVLRAAASAAIASPFALAAFGAIIERTSYVINEVDLPIPNLHPDLEGVKIAQISDLHVSPFLSVSEAGRVVDMTNELRPDVALFTGDLITQPGDPLDAAIREIGRLRAADGVLGCLGNHESYARCEDYTTREASKLGLRFLRNEAIQIRKGNGVLNIAGVDYQRRGMRHGYLPHAENLIAPGVSNLLLSHNPDVFPIAVRKGYDAVVSGHTHGGQVTVEILKQEANLARFFTPYVAGLYRIEGRSCYVNAGIGTIGMPMRLGAPPEITLFRLHRA